MFRSSIPTQTVFLQMQNGDGFWISATPFESVWNAFDQPRTQDEISDTISGFHPGLAITPQRLDGGLERARSVMRLTSVLELVDGMGFEPTTPALRTRCSPN